MATNYLAVTNFAFTGGVSGLASLANGSAVQTDLIKNPNSFPAGVVQLKITTGTGPTAGSLVNVYLLRGDSATGSSTYVTDGGGATSASITVQNAALLGTIVVQSGSTAYYGDFD